MANPTISTVTLPSGTTYDIKDAQARADIEALNNYTAYLGVTTTELTDGATTNPITIGGESVTAKNGNIANYGSKEFIFNGTAWQEFGDLSGLGDLAFKSSASGSFTPSGSVSQPTFTGTQKYLHITATKGTTTSTGNFTPSGSVELTTTAKTPTLSKAAGTSSDYTVKEVSSVSVGTSSTTPTITVAEGTSSNGYQVKGTVSAPTITVTPSTTTVNSITAVGTLPEFTATVSNENLTFGWSAGTLPTKGSNTTVATGISSATASQPTFTGGYVKATSSAVTTPTGSATVTPSYVKLSNGSIDVPTSASFEGTQDSVSVTTTGAVTAVSGSVNTTATDGIDIKPSGTVSQPSFTGTAGTVSVS